MSKSSGVQGQETLPDARLATLVSWTAGL